MPRGKQTVSDSDIIQAMADHPDPFIRTDELAEEFGFTRQWAHSRLQDLVEDGPVKKKSGARSAIYWLPL
jgi:predicted transcriptional regulator